MPRVLVKKSISLFLGAGFCLLAATFSLAAPTQFPQQSGGVAGEPNTTGSASSLENTGPSQSSNPEDYTIDLGGDGFDMALDSTRDQLFISVPSLNEIVVISTVRFVIDDRISVVEPHGIELSHDNNFLYIALGTGSVGVLDLNSNALTTIDVSTEVGHASIYDVIEAKPNRLFVAANSDPSPAHIAMIKTDQGNAVSTVADGREIGVAPRFLKDPNEQFLYIGEQTLPNSLFKLDITQDTAPIVLESLPGTVSGTDYMITSNDGTLIALRNGQFIHSSTFSVAGAVGGGIPVSINNNGETRIIVTVLNSSFHISIYDLENGGVNVIVFPIVCTLPTFQEFKGPFILGGDTLCTTVLGNTPLIKFRNDFDGDTDSDLLMVDGSGNIVSGILENSVAQSFGYLLQADPAAGWSVHATTDFNGDGKFDLFLFNSTNGDYRVVTLDGTATQTDTTVVVLDPAYGLEPRGVGDFDGDGVPEITVYHPSSGYTALIYFAGGVFSSFEFVTTVDEANNWTLIDTADFTGDGRSDFLIQNTVTGETAVIEMNGSTPVTTTPIFTLDPALGLTIEDTADFTGDGKVDILALHTSGALAVLEMDGTSFQSVYVPGGLLPNWQLVNAGRYDGDNKADFLFFDPTTGELITGIQDGATITTYNTVLNFGPASGWTFHKGKP